MNLLRSIEHSLGLFTMASAALALVGVGIALWHVMRGDVRNSRRQTIGLPAFLGVMVSACCLWSEQARWQSEQYLIYVIACWLLVPLVLCDTRTFRAKYVGVVPAALLLQLLFNRGLPTSNGDLLVGLAMGLIPAAVLITVGAASDEAEARRRPAPHLELIGEPEDRRDRPNRIPA